MKDNVYLIGFMGCGKTTIGNQVAVRLARDFIDLDKEIENREQVSIPYLFEQKGEAYFRNIESTILLQTQEMKNGVIATGGGIISREVNREFLKSQKTIYLEWDFKTLYERIKYDCNRPNVKSYRQLKNLYESRIPFYESAQTHTIKCESKSKGAIVMEIINWLGGDT